MEIEKVEVKRDLGFVVKPLYRIRRWLLTRKYSRDDTHEQSWESLVRAGLEHLIDKCEMWEAKPWMDAREAEIRELEDELEDLVARLDRICEKYKVEPK